MSESLLVLRRAKEPYQGRMTTYVELWCGVENCDEWTEPVDMWPGSPDPYTRWLEMGWRRDATLGWVCPYHAELLASGQAQAAPATTEAPTLPAPTRPATPTPPPPDTAPTTPTPNPDSAYTPVARHLLAWANAQGIRTPLALAERLDMDHQRLYTWLRPGVTAMLPRGKSVARLEQVTGIPAATWRTLIHQAQRERGGAWRRRTR